MAVVQHYTMKQIYGIRFYPQTVKIVQGIGAPICLHDRLAERTSDIHYIFRPLGEFLRSKFITDDFCVCYDERGILEDPVPGLKERYAQNLVGWDLKRQIVFLDGSAFDVWGPNVYSCEGAFHQVFEKGILGGAVGEIHELDDALADFQDAWPDGLCSIIHMWDDIYWQYFTVDHSEIDLLVEAHRRDTRLKMFEVDVRKEYPDPSNEDLVEIT
jgi:hypothetical protein